MPDLVRGGKVDPHSDGYSRAQIALHWIIAALILAILFTHEEFLAIQAAQLRSGPVSVGQSVVRGLHLWGGAVVFPLAVWRTVIRVRLGVPAPPRHELRAFRSAASCTHLLFYILIFVLPVSGVLVYFCVLPSASGAIHHFGEPVLILLALAHVGASLMHHFYWKTDVLRRMLKSTR